MGIDPKIFKSYDIRGTYPDQVNEEVAYQLGRAFVVYTKATTLIVGRDVRTSGPALREALIRGIVEQGADVIDIGMVSTDMFYFACASKNLPGITITASHNPKEYNGFKMVKAMPHMVSGEAMRSLVAGGAFESALKKGSARVEDISEGFVHKMRSIFDLKKIPPLKVVVDPANGMGGVVFDLVCSEGPLLVVRMNFEPDGTFPNHGGDPLLPENRKDLEARVVAEKADLGFAFDPDADRFFAVDSSGAFVHGDFLTALFARYLIEQGRTETIVYDLRSSWAVRDLVGEAGGRAVESPVGTRFIKEKMSEVNATFAGEVTGHYYFANFFSADSAVATALLLLEMLGYYEKPLAELLAPLRGRYFKSGEINATVADPDAVLAKIKEHYAPTCEIQELDGVSIIAPDWHANIRKSNTEPLLRMMAEAIGNEKLMEEKRDELLALIRE